MMPDLSKSVLVNGRYYCWDKEQKTITEIEVETNLKLKPLSMENIPAEAMEIFIALLNAKEN